MLLTLPLSCISSACVACPELGAGLAQRFAMCYARASDLALALGPSRILGLCAATLARNH